MAPLAGSTLVAVVLLLLSWSASRSVAQVLACGELAVNVMIRAGERSADAAETARRAFDRLADLTDSARTGADRLFVGASDVRAEAAMRELLQRRTKEEAEAIFLFANRAPANARQGMLKASGLRSVDGVSPGASMYKLLSSSHLEDAGKSATLNDLGELVDLGLDGTAPLLKRAAEQVGEPNFGNLFEIQASAAIRRDGRFGSLVDVFVDRGGPPGITGVDTFTTTHAFQMKSKVNPSDEILLGDDVPMSKLKELLRDKEGRSPVLVHSNPLHADLKAACDELKIDTLQMQLVR